jgi:HSP20 family protein
MSKITEVQETAQRKEAESAHQSGLPSTSQRRDEAIEKRDRDRYPWGRPFSLIRRFSEEMDRLFEDFGSWGVLPGERESNWGWTPRVETFERQGKFVVRAELPGVTKDQVKVEVTDDSLLTIQGDRRNQHEEKKEGYYRSECSYGHFYRTIRLPERTNTEGAVAKFQNGVLEIEMAAPQQPEIRGRRIEIQEVPHHS